MSDRSKEKCLADCNLISSVCVSNEALDKNCKMKDDICVLYDTVERKCLEKYSATNCDNCNCDTFCKAESSWNAKNADIVQRDNIRCCTDDHRWLTKEVDITSGFMDSYRVPIWILLLLFAIYLCIFWFCAKWCKGRKEKKNLASDAGEGSGCKGVILGILTYM